MPDWLVQPPNYDPARNGPIIERRIAFIAKYAKSENSCREGEVV